MSFDQLQRPLDAASNRIISVGTPVAASDATITDNATAPSDPAAVAAPGASFLAAPANHVHQGLHSVHANASANLFGDVQIVDGTGMSITQSGQIITVSAAGGSVNKITFADAWQHYVTGTSEEIVAEWYVNFADAGSAGNVQARLSAIVKVGAGTGTYNLYVGATAPGSTAGGTIRVAVTSTSTSDEVKTNLGAAFANPAAGALVQLTAVNGTAAIKSFVRGAQVSFG